ncbi:hypothetical protein [Kamptonema formosum]|uniref:hypothetical protein n=1 Tax=Kamptonema formosum TaxID=331992 RepID=UPI00035C105D|nr:hypothetical protein [Oscillatoria sp. PCC 10802]
MQVYLGEDRGEWGGLTALYPAVAGLWQSLLPHSAPAAGETVKLQAPSGAEARLRVAPAPAPARELAGLLGSLQRLLYTVMGGARRSARTTAD